MLSDFSIDETPHNRDGLVITARDADLRVDAFISRKVMDEWVDPIIPAGRGRSLYRSQYNDLGRRNLPAIARIVSAKYERGKTFNRQPPYVEVLTDDIIDSGEVIDQSGLVRHPLPPAFHSILR
ncbi:signal transduction histidine kinase [Bradyrhizobium sp. LHD-71]|uniref:signal transduction histidine kinase n=1 Tax=Bradyrhizobium sp. LHD-71 TaxID=3072141 RepID=UPI00280FB7E8|nr:signal transduction histidine kinase [Bradyrhizobium sp. LHD-71]MDQ8728153.1 signal transduction histidine kinase [Bradyrhizobium sp. LHD-71]